MWFMGIEKWLDFLDCENDGPELWTYGSFISMSMSM